MHISDWSSDVGSSDLRMRSEPARRRSEGGRHVRSFLLPLALRRLGLRGDLVIVEIAIGLGQRRHLQLRLPARLGVDRLDLDILDRDDARQRSDAADEIAHRSEEHTSELQSLMRTSYAVSCLKKKIHKNH